MKIVRRKMALKGSGKKNTIKILAQGDQHCDDPGHIHKSFDRFIEAVKEAPEGSGCFLLGDMFTFANTRSQKALRKAFPDATEDAQESVDGFVQEMARPLRKKLEPIKDRIWGMVEGNHGWRFQDGTTVDQRLAEIMDVPYSDGMLIVCLNVSRHPSEGHGHSCRIVCHHGSTGATTISGDINSLIKHQGYFSNAHIILEGHTHGLSVLPDERLVITESTSEPMLKHQISWTARCGSSVGSYRPGKAGYPERKMLKPSMPGHVEFDVWFEQHYIGRKQKYINGKLVNVENGRSTLDLCILGRTVPLQGVSVGVAG